jgi:cytosine/adenosine deaminase-related metal-dependent hydrolase
MRTLTRLLLLSAVLPSCRPAVGGAQQPIAFTNVTVVPMDRERLLSGYTVVIQGDRITAMGPASEVRVPEGATRVDGQGRYLMPGLAEMHGHIPPGDAPERQIEKVLAFYALNGVTTVRGMLGSPRHLAWRERANRGEVLSPTIYTTGPSFNGNSVKSPADAIRMVTEQKAAGYDLMKIHPGVPREAYDSMAATARRLNIRFAGHIPAEVGIRRALEHRQWTVDHVDGYVEGLVWDGTGSPPQSQFFGFNLGAQADESRLADLVQRTKAAGTAIVPTQSLFESMLGPYSPDELADWPEMRYWPAQTVAQWKQNTINNRQQSEVTAESGQRFLELRRRIMKALHQGGVPFLLGSDAPQWWNVPGFSIQRELDAMAKAGFTPYQAYEMGTRNVAEHFGAADQFGTVAVGKRADLVLLEANPLDDVSNWSKRAGVMVRGKWYDKGEINRRLVELSRSD